VNLQSTSKFRPLSNPVIVCLLLALATFAIYWPVKNYGFVNFDDNEYFFNNPHVLGGLAWANIKWAFTTADTGNWLPLTWLSLMLDVQLFGSDASAPHIINVLLHAANALLVFVLLRQLTGALWRSAAVAMLFALHPMHVESVAWVAERKDVLSSFFGLLTLLFYARYAVGKNHQPASLGASFVLALLFFICALMSKSMVVTLPFVMLLLDFWPLQRFSPTSLKSLLLEKIPFFLAVVADSIATFIAQQKGNAVTPLAWFPPGLRLGNVFVSYARYLGKIVWPFNLATPYAPLHYWPAPVVAFSFLLFVVLCIAAFALRKKFPYAFTGWFWFVGMLVPVIGLVQVGAQSLADRYIYLPIIGVLILVVWGIAEICAVNQTPRGAMIFCAVFLCLACALRARNQVSVWQDDGTLFGHALAVTENNNVAMHNLGYWYQKNGQTDKAMDYYFDADQLGSRDPGKLYNAANQFAKLGHWDEAIKIYRRALQLSPNQPDVLNNLGFALAQNKQLPEAAVCFEIVLKLQPGSADAHNNLATILFSEGDLPGAAIQFSDALQLAPDNFSICANLAGTYERLNQTNLAVKYYQQAQRLQPENQQVRARLQSLGVHVTN